MKQYGLVKVIKEGDDEIKLCGNAMTFVLYKSYFGRDLLNDIIDFAKKNTANVSYEELQNLGRAEDLSDEQAQQIFEKMGDFQFDSEFVLNFIASLMATAQYPAKPDVAELICSIPPNFILNQGIITELMDFLSLFVAQKKSSNHRG